jgi:hypothetical protein
MPCVRQTAKRYKSRPSPPFHARDCKGETKEGNDGAPYVSVANAKGVFQWIKKRNSATLRKGKQEKKGKQSKQSKQGKPKMKVYRTLDNGGYPYRVTIDPTHILVEHLTYDYSDGDFTKEPATITPVCDVTNYKKLWIGQGIDMFYPKDYDPSFVGNSIVAQKSDNTCIFIGTNVTEFDRVPGDSFDTAILHSHVGSNAVPYPYLIAATHTYMLLDFVAVPNELLDFTDQDNKDCYAQFYGHVPHAGGKKGSLGRQAIKLKTKKIHKARR